MKQFISIYKLSSKYSCHMDYTDGSSVIEKFFNYIPVYYSCTGICVFSTKVHGKTSLPPELRQCFTTVIRLII